MDKYKLSQWHDGDVKPVHVGLYQVKTKGESSVLYSWWDGEVFNGHWLLEDVLYKKDFWHKYPDGCSETHKWRCILK